MRSVRTLILPDLSEFPFVARKVLITCSSNNIYEFAPIIVDKFWAKSTTFLPDSRHLRLQVDVGARLKIMGRADSHYDQMADVVAFPKLQTFEIEAFVFSLSSLVMNQNNNLLHFRTRREVLVATIASKAVGAKIKVVDHVRELEAQSAEHFKPVESTFDQALSPDSIVSSGMDVGGFMHECLLKIGRHIMSERLGDIEPAFWHNVAEHY